MISLFSDLFDTSLFVYCCVISASFQRKFGGACGLRFASQAVLSPVLNTLKQAEPNGRIFFSANQLGFVSNIFYVHPENWGRFPIWLIFFQMGWNHQLELGFFQINSILQQNCCSDTEVPGGFFKFYFWWRWLDWVLCLGSFWPMERNGKTNKNGRNNESQLVGSKCFFFVFLVAPEKSLEVFNCFLFLSGVLFSWRDIFRNFGIHDQ